MRNRILIAITVISTIVVGVTLAVTGREYYDTNYGAVSLCAEFRDSVGLYPDNNVTMLGLNVGTVESIEPDGDHVVVHMSIDRNLRLPANLGAVTVASSLVTDRRVELTPPYTSGGTFDSNTCIPKDRTKTPAGFTESLRAITNLSNDLTGKDSKAPAEEPAPNTLSESLAVVAAQVDKSGAPLNQSIKNLSDLLGDTASAANFVLRQVLDNIGKVSQELGDTTGNLDAVLAGITDAANITGRVFPDLTRLVEDLAVFIPPLVRTFTRWGKPLIAMFDVGVPAIHGALVNVPSVVDVLRQVPTALQTMTSMFDQDLRAGRVQYRPPNFRVSPKLAADVCGTVQLIAPGNPLCNRDFTQGGTVDLGIVQLILAAAGTR